MEWQPIETAKHDGPPVLVTDELGRIAISHVLGDEWHQFEDGVPMLFQPRLGWKPTHWMPLPEPPK